MNYVVEKIFSQYGFGAALAVGIFCLLHYVLKSVISEVRQMFQQSQQREDKLLNIIEKYHVAIEGLAVEIKTIQQTTKTADEYQRREHEKMLSLLEGLRAVAGNG